MPTIPKKYIKIEEVHRVISIVRNMYKEEVFRPVSESQHPDCFAAAGARVALDTVESLIAPLVEKLNVE